MNENIDTSNSNKIIINTDDLDIFYFSNTDILTPFMTGSYLL